MIAKKLLSKLTELYEEHRFGYDRLAKKYHLLGLTSVTMRLVPVEHTYPAENSFPDGWTELNLNVEIEHGIYTSYNQKRRVAHIGSEGQIPHIQRDRLWDIAEQRAERYRRAFEEHGISVVF